MTVKTVLTTVPLQTAPGGGRLEFVDICCARISERREMSSLNVNDVPSTCRYSEDKIKAGVAAGNRVLQEDRSRKINEGDKVESRRVN